MAIKLPAELQRLVGQTVKKADYRIEEYRASGKRGHLFRATDQYERERALKFIPRKKLNAGWEEEARKAHLLDDQPNTVRFYELFFHNEFAVMVFDFVSGTSLQERIDQGSLTVADIERVLYNLVFFRRDCLVKGLRHGDLHPGNIIIRQPTMGPPREYEVMITDFGIGYTGAVLQPKDDLNQIGLIAVRMLQSISREDLDRTDRGVYDELCRWSTGKDLRETSELERSNDEAVASALADELLQVRRRVYTPDAEPDVHPRFGDYLAGEQLGNRWKQWGELFVSDFPGYEDIVSRNTTVLTGSRGCGKTMVFRRLSKLLAFKVGPVDDRAAGGALVGFYLNMNDIGDAFLYSLREVPPKQTLAKRVTQFFHLSLLSEIVRVAAIAREEPSGAGEYAGAHDRANHWLFDFVADQVALGQLPYPGTGLELRSAGAAIERAKDYVRRSGTPPDRLAPLAENDWLKRLVRQLQERMPWVAGRPIYFFLDDYSLPRVSSALQMILNSVIFQRSDSFFFKISTESPSTLHRTDYTGKTLDEPHDFELTDLGSVTIDLPDSERERFLDEVFRRRFEREERFRDRTLTDVLGEFEKTWAQLARDIRKGDKVRVYYHGRNVFLNMWSGDTRSMVRVAVELLGQLPTGGPLQLPIRPDAQDKVLRQTGGEFLHLLESCTRTSRQSTVPLPPHIPSWGKHLVKVAQAFKEIALHELRTRIGGRKGRGNEPKQAFRIEIFDRLSLGGIEAEIYADLVRHGVFLRDDRGKSVRGAIIPRLYLRRLLIPFCTLTFSKADNVAMKAADFKSLLLHPEDVARNWKRNRAAYDVTQKDLPGFE